MLWHLLILEDQQSKMSEDQLAKQRAPHHCEDEKAGASSLRVIRSRQAIAQQAAKRPLVRQTWHSWVLLTSQIKHL